jgi:hypothetical protein
MAGHILHVRHQLLTSNEGCTNNGIESGKSKPPGWDQNVFEIRKTLLDWTYRNYLFGFRADWIVGKIVDE